MWKRAAQFEIELQLQPQWKRANSTQNWKNIKNKQISIIKTQEFLRTRNFLQGTVHENSLNKNRRTPSWLQKVFRSSDICQKRIGTDPPPPFFFCTSQLLFIFFRVFVCLFVWGLTFFKFKTRYKVPVQSHLIFKKKKIKIA